MILSFDYEEVRLILRFSKSAADPCENKLKISIIRKLQTL
jgi:hypothetical protein